MTAPESLAMAMDCLIWLVLQSKSMAHWLRLQVATFNSLILQELGRTDTESGKKDERGFRI